VEKEERVCSFRKELIHHIYLNIRQPCIQDYLRKTAIQQLFNSVIIR